MASEAPVAHNSTNHHHLDDSMDSDQALKRIQTAGSISISPELFEKIYLSPQNQVKGELRKTFANPTPIALVGFLLSLTPLSCQLMNWRRSGRGNGIADTAIYFFFGGILMLSGALGEFILGNTFPMVVFGSFGAFWLSFGGTLQPFYHAYNTAVYPKGPASPGFLTTFAFFLVFMGVLCFCYLILSLRTNAVFVLIFFTLCFAFPLLAAWFWYAAEGHVSYSNKMKLAGGAFVFVTCMAGWWIFMAIMLAALDFPFQLPVFDLSHIIKGASEKK